MEIGQDLFQHQLGIAVGIGGGQWEILPDRHAFRTAVNRRRRAEHQVFDPMLPHDLAEDQRPSQVVVIIFQRLLDRLPNRLQPGEVDNVRNFFTGEQFLNSSPVQQVCFIKRDFFPGQFLYPLQGNPAGVGQVVNHHHFITLV